MKKVIVILLLSIFATGLHITAQISNTPSKTNKLEANALLLKSKKQNTVAWILLGGGIAFYATGLIVYSNEKAKNPSAELDILPKGTAFSALGGSMMIASIPFFLSSGKNKRKANLTIKNETVNIPQVDRNHFITVGIKMNL